MALWPNLAIDRSFRPIILVMGTTSLADVKSRLSEIVAETEKTHERTIITKNGRPVAVIVAIEDLEGLEETLDILSHPEEAEALRAAIADDRPGERVTMDEMAAVLAERRRRAGQGLTHAEADEIIAEHRRRSARAS